MQCLYLTIRILTVQEFLKITFLEFVQNLLQSHLCLKQQRTPAIYRRTLANVATTLPAGIGTPGTNVAINSTTVDAVATATTSELKKSANRNALVRNRCHRQSQRFHPNLTQNRPRKLNRQWHHHKLLVPHPDRPRWTKFARLIPILDRVRTILLTIITTVMRAFVRTLLMAVVAVITTILKRRTCVYNIAVSFF